MGFKWKIFYFYVKCSNINYKSKVYLYFILGRGGLFFILDVLIVI